MKYALSLATVVAAVLAIGTAQASEAAFAVSDEQLARLGVRLEKVETVDLVELAAAPAEIVVPPARQALVSAPLGGVIARLLVAEGDTVAAGQPLAELDSVAFVEAQRDYLDAVAASELAAAQEARDRGLYDEGVIAQRRLAETAATAAAARSRMDQARAQLELAGTTAADLTRLATRRQLDARIVLRAPLAGVVTATHVDVGGRVDALDPVVAVADLSELWLELRVAQESAALVAPGMTAVVTPPGGATVTGEITTIGRVVDPDTQTVLVRAKLGSDTRSLRSGQVLTARILARPLSGVALVVPAAAMTRNGDELLVFVREGTDVHVCAVEVIAQDGTRAYVATGIDADDRIAVDGMSALKALWLASATEGG